MSVCSSAFCPNAAVIATPSGLPEQWKLCAFMHNSDTGPNNAIVFHSWASTNFSNLSVVFWSLSRVDALAVRRNEKKGGTANSNFERSPVKSFK